MKKTLPALILTLFLLFGLCSTAQAATQSLTTPTISAFASVDEGVKISWKSVKGAERYAVYYKGKNGWTRMGTTTDTTFIDTDVSSGSTYTYTVRCMNNAATAFTSSFNSAGWKYTYNMTTPQITSLKGDIDGIHITWNAVPNASKYRVYYKGSKGWTKLTTTAETSYIDSAVSYGTAYTYTVRCISANEKRFTSSFNSTGWKIQYYLDTPSIKDFDSVDEGVKITWNEVIGAERYAVYYKGSKGWTRMGTTTDTSYIDTDVSSGSTYTYTVRCLNSSGSKFTSDFNSTGWRYTYNMAVPKITSLKSADDGIHISWDAVPNAAKYRVYCKVNNSWKKLTSTTDTSFTDSSVSYNKSYTYTVRCVNAKDSRFTSSFNTAGWNTTYSCTTPVLSSISASSDGIHLTWNKSNGVERYRVYRKSTGSWSRIANVQSTEYTDSNIAADTTYTYTVRCLSTKGEAISDFDRKGLSAVYVTPTEQPLDAPASVKAEITESGSRVYDTVGKWSIWRRYSDTIGNESDQFDFIANEAEIKMHPGEKALDKEYNIESYLDYSDDGSKVTIHWNKTPDIEGQTFTGYSVVVYRKTKDEEKYLGEMSYRQRSKSEGFTWAAYDYDKGAWIKDPTQTGDTSYTFDLPLLSETPAEAKLSWDSVDRADKYTVEVLQNNKWIVAGIVDTNTYSFTPEYDSTVQYRIKAETKNGTSSPYTYKTVITKSEFVKDSEGYSYEDPVMEYQHRNICNGCGMDITGDKNYPQTTHLANGKTTVSYPYIGDRLPEAYENYLKYKETHPSISGNFIMDEEEFRYGHRDIYQYVNPDDGTYYTVWDDGRPFLEYSSFDMIMYHGTADNLDGTGCQGGRWHDDYRNVEIGTRIINVPASGHYEVTITE